MAESLQHNKKAAPRQRSVKQNRIAQAFKQAPWRGRIQLAGGFLVGLVIVLLVASVYLRISGEAATAGLEAYSLDLERLDLEREIANANANIASLTSASNMEARAKDMGFKRIDPADAEYITIPGYPGRQTMRISAQAITPSASRQLVKSIYRESLWDWLFSGINSLRDTVIEGTN